MQLSPHFTLEELTASETARKLSINNTPSQEIINNLYNVARTLELVRHILGDKPITVTSGYRCPQLNMAVGGAKDSSHLQGLAADFLHPVYGPYSCCQLLHASSIDYDQLIHEFTWTHIGIGPQMRREVLTAEKDMNRIVYRPGL